VRNYQVEDRNPPPPREILSALLVWMILLLARRTVRQGRCPGDVYVLADDGRILWLGTIRGRCRRVSIRFRTCRSAFSSRLHARVAVRVCSDRTIAQFAHTRGVRRRARCIEALAQAVDGSFGWKSTTGCIDSTVVLRAYRLSPGGSFPTEAIYSLLSLRQGRALDAFHPGDQPPEERQAPRIIPTTKVCPARDMSFSAGSGRNDLAAAEQRVGRLK